MAPRTVRRRLARIARILLLISFTVCLLLSLILALRTALFIRGAVWTTGNVTRMVERKNEEDNSLQYAPLFEFTAKDGKSYTILSDIATNPPEFAAGDSATVLYPAQNPAAAKLSSFWQLWLLPLIFIAVGVVHGFFGGLIWLLERRANVRAIQKLDLTRNL